MSDVHTLHPNAVRRSSRPLPARVKDNSWSHQIELGARRGERIAVLLMDGAELKGKLLEADQFTVKIEADITGGKTITATHFKHSIAGYSFL